MKNIFFILLAFLFCLTASAQNVNVVSNTGVQKIAVGTSNGLGQIINEQFANKTNFTEAGTATFTIVSNALQVSSASGSLVYTNVANQTAYGVTNLEDWVQTCQVTVGTITATSFGIGIGVNSTIGGSSLTAFVNLSSGSQGTLSITANSLTTSSNTPLTVAAGHVLTYTLRRSKNVITFTVFNANNNLSQTVSLPMNMGFSRAVNQILPTAGNFTIFALGGTHTIDNWVIKSDAVKNAVLFIGDSIFEGYAGANSNSRTMDVLAKTFNENFTSIASQSNTTADFSATEILSLAPTKIIINLGINNIGGGQSAATAFTNLQSLISSITALTNPNTNSAYAVGTDVFICTILPRESNLSTIQTFNSSIRSTYTTSVIELEKPFLNASGTAMDSTLYADIRNTAVHPNDKGNQLMAEIIGNYQPLNFQKKSYEEKYFMPVVQNLNGRATVGNRFTNSDSNALVISHTSNSAQLKLTQQNSGQGVSFLSSSAGGLNIIQNGNFIDGSYIAYSAAPSIFYADGTTFRFYMNSGATPNAVFTPAEKVRITSSGIYSIGGGATPGTVSNPTAHFHSASGTTAANTAPLKLALVAPALNTTPEKYAVEADSATGGGNIYYTNAAGTRKAIDFISDSTKNNTDSIQAHLAPTAALLDSSSKQASTAFVQRNALSFKLSRIFPTRYSYQAAPIFTGGIGSNWLEFLNIGNFANTTDSIAIEAVGLIASAGRVTLSRNMVFDSAQSKWISPIKGALGYGAGCLEIGGEAIILHSTPAGVNFSDVPHEILLASANGTDGVTGHKITTGYFTQSKAPFFANYDSAAYDIAQTNNAWNSPASTNPLFWSRSERNKFSDNDFFRSEVNGSIGWGAYYNLKSRGTIVTKTTVVTGDTLGRYGWKGYDGTNDIINAAIDGYVSGTVSTGVVRGNIRFSTSPTNTAGLRPRMEITGDSIINIIGSSTRGILTNSTSVPSYSGVGFSPALTTSTGWLTQSLSNTTGGYLIYGFSTTSNTASSLLFRGWGGGTAPTVANTIFRANKWDGANNSTTLASSEIGWQWDNNGTVVARMLGDGNFSVSQTGSPTAKVHIGAGTTAASTAPLKFTTGTNMTVAEAGAFEYTTPQLFFTNGGAQRQEIPLIQQSRVSTQYDNTTTTLGDVTGLTATVVAGKIYRFEATLFSTSDVAGGIKAAIGGTATATSIRYEVLITDAGLTTQGRQTALAGATGVTAVTAALIKIEGTITVNAAGTITCQAAQNANTGTTSVLTGSTFVLTEML